LRQLLVDTGTPQAPFDSGHIGPLPDLSAALATAVPCGHPTVVPAPGGTITGTTSGVGSLGAICGGAQAPEVAFQWTPDRSGTALIDTCGSGTTYDTVLHLRSDSCESGAEAACNDDACTNATGNVRASRITPTVVAGTTYVIVVDGFGDEAGTFTLTVTPPSCALDVDGDGTAAVASDVVYLARHLLNLTPVPPGFRQEDPSIPDDATIIAAIDALGTALDVDGDGNVSASTDVVYIARRRLNLAPVPPSFRNGDPTIPSDPVISANVDGLCP
jgi:hypothetical protein